MSVMASRPVLRWAVPAVVLAAIVGSGVAGRALQASAHGNIPSRSAAQLLADVATAQLSGAAGTVLEKADLGLPTLPDNLTGGSGSAQLNSLLSGSHTLRVWYSGPTMARVQLLGALGESDIVRNGQDVWIWSFQDNSVVHQRVPVDRRPATLPEGLPTTPQQAAAAVLAALTPTTVVTASNDATVAGRAAYQLSLSPRDHGSLVSHVDIAIDAATHIPVRVRVYAKSYSKPAFEIGFTQVSFKRPDSALFRFTTPRGAKVTEHLAMPEQAPDIASVPAKSAVVGSGWSSIAVVRTGNATPATPGGLASVTELLPRVSGSWGSGRLLTSRLFSILLTDDGRILAGAVSGDALTTAAASPAAALK